MLYNILELNPGTLGFGNRIGHGISVGMTANEIPPYLCALLPDKIIVRKLSDAERQSVYEKIKDTTYDGWLNDRVADWLRNKMGYSKLAMFYKNPPSIGEEIEITEPFLKLWEKEAAQRYGNLHHKFFDNYILMVGQQIVFRKLTDIDRIYDIYGNCNHPSYCFLPYDWHKKDIARRFLVDAKFGQTQMEKPYIIAEECEIEQKQLHLYITKDNLIRKSEKMQYEIEEQPIEDGGIRKYLVSFGTQAAFVRKLSEEETRLYSEKSKDEFFKIIRPYLDKHHMYWRKWTVCDKKPIAYELIDDEPNLKKKLKLSLMPNHIITLTWEGILRIKVNESVKRFIREAYYNKINKKEEHPGNCRDFVKDWFGMQERDDLAMQVCYSMPYKEDPDFVYENLEGR